MLAALSNDHSGADISEADKAMLDYALKLTLKPGDMREQDAVMLRQEGFDDRAIHDICAVTAYFNFVNRMADGLGVDLEEDTRFPVPGIPALH